MQSADYHESTHGQLHQSRLLLGLHLVKKLHPKHNQGAQYFECKTPLHPEK
jgi:hypothetical protein